MSTILKSVPLPQPRVARFEQLAYGLFLHWGLYSQLGRGEWIQHHAPIAAADYEPLIAKFTAHEFDARAVARLAREAGMRYIVLTTRHHEGFSLYDTRGLSDFDAPHSPAGRDLVAEFVDGCRAEGIVPFFYHTTLDWRWNSQHCDESKFNEYLDYLQASVEILCRNYETLGGLWFDGNWSRQADWKEDRLYAAIRRYQPEAMIINNSGLGHLGAVGHPELDSTTFEQGLPSAPDRTGWPKYLAGEMCETLNEHWGIAVDDFHYKGPADVIHHLCACRRVGANYLLNIGPTASGAIPDYEAAVLRKAGRWVAQAGPVVYEGKPVPTVCAGRDFVLRRGDCYYYFAHALSREGSVHVVTEGGSTGPRTISGLGCAVDSVRWVDSREPVRFIQSPDHSLLTLDCHGYRSGVDLLVRIAELCP